MMHIQVRHEIYLTTHESETSLRKFAVHLPDFDGTFLHTNLLPNMRTFDNMRKTLGLETKEKAVLRKLSKTQDGKAHIHGYKTQRLESVLDTSELLDEAQLKRLTGQLLQDDMV